MLVSCMCIKPFRGHCGEESQVKVPPYQCQNPNVFPFLTLAHRPTSREGNY